MVLHVGEKSSLWQECPSDTREHAVSIAIPSAPVCASLQTSSGSSTIHFKPTYGNAGPLPVIIAVQRQGKANPSRLRNKSSFPHISIMSPFNASFKRKEYKSVLSTTFFLVLMELSPVRTESRQHTHTGSEVYKAVVTFLERTTSLPTTGKRGFSGI